MLQSFKELQFVIGNGIIVEKMPTLPSFAPFDEKIIDFFNALSRKLMAAGKKYSDVATFGFWCRRAALLKEKAKYDDLSQRIGRGIVFHSTPSNVAVNFAFSFAAGFLAGNANIVRLPGKPFEQVDLICACIKELLSTDFAHLAPYVCMVKYPPIVEITDEFCKLCDTRVVWGGDGTIAEIRKSPLKPRANEIAFADRYSVAVINADAYLAYEQKDNLTIDFYNDTYFSDQNACTTPRVIVWTGKEKEKAQKIFWEKIEKSAQEKYTLAPVQAVGKLTAFCKVAVCRDAQIVQTQSNFVTRIKVNEIDEKLMDYRYNSGYFYEYDADSLNDILPLCTARCQTLTYFGLTKEEIADFIRTNHPHGVDRFVPIGKSMNFTLTWDGYDLIRAMSRYIEIA